MSYYVTVNTIPSSDIQKSELKAGNTTDTLPDEFMSILTGILELFVVYPQQLKRRKEEGLWPILS